MWIHFDREKLRRVTMHLLWIQQFLLPLVPQPRLEILHNSFFFAFACVTSSALEYFSREVLDSEYYGIAFAPAGTPICQSTQPYVSPNLAVGPLGHTWLQLRTFGKLQKYTRGDRIIEDVYIINPALMTTKEKFDDHIRQVCYLLQQPDARGSFTQSVAFKDHENQVIPTHHGLFDHATILAISRLQEVKHIRYMPYTGQDLLEAAKEE
ncbi:hypothetical protein CKAH01_14662 [Colletotrichum kahawae]|uniref:Uncharacterized protein n=1 Tax=Colletotrichum kahawae TaxID=34407 RepID=A0AAD9YKD4_COLKA|nr:hypothetical protein CKAH01_14662 [Colletotrichum kahawae]